jgi:S-adenosylmethionine synthetase
MSKSYFFTSESVTEGHPDKMCDQISDAVLDQCLGQDPNSRVACETTTKTGMVLVSGEITTKAYVDLTKVVRGVIKDIGYIKNSQGIEWETCAVLSQLEEQSPDISMGVTANKTKHKEQGAGDQGMMFGFAIKETPELMPLPIMMAHKLTRQLAKVRKAGLIKYLGPDGKSQVTVAYQNDRPTRIDTVVVSSQHDDGIAHSRIEQDIKKYVIKPVCGKWIDSKTKFHINPTGKFVRGGPFADTGLTGRKIIVDTYGGMGRHGGGAFSGKDPSKVDRSAAYMARYIAKNIVGAGLAYKCEVQLAYAIGVADPVSIFVDTFGTGTVDDKKISRLVYEVFPVKPRQIIEHLKLKRPVYRQTAAYGHFGRNEKDFTWEKLDKVAILRKKAFGK